MLLMEGFVIEKVLSHIPRHLILTTCLRGRYFFLFHFIDGETDAPGM